jgi:uncharacterized protein (DUF111 family)
MKKGRPGYVLSALCDPSVSAQIAELIGAETGTLGIRATTMQRWPASRTVSAVDVGGAPIRVKVSPGRVKVEHDDAARVARRTGLPLREVVRRAEVAWHQHPADGPPESPPEGDPA